MMPILPADRWAKLRERLRDLARLPVIGLSIFIAAMFAWLGAWAVWRVCEWVFHFYLKESWVP